MPQPELIITSIATALIQCMIRTGQGCSSLPPAAAITLAVPPDVTRPTRPGSSAQVAGERPKRSPR